MHHTIFFGESLQHPIKSRVPLTKMVGASLFGIALAKLPEKFLMGTPETWPVIIIIFTKMMWL